MINVNSVYRTVLLILNKEQRGYMTPAEFNRVATQVQLEIFEQYFDDLNQQLRVPQSDTDYADRQVNIDENLSTFKVYGEAVYNAGNENYWELPSTVGTSGIIYDGTEINPIIGSPTVNNLAFYRLGTVTYHPTVGYPVELQRVDRSEFYTSQQSPLTRATEAFPIYLYEGVTDTQTPIIHISPNNSNTRATGVIKVDFIRKPKQVIWGYNVGSLQQYEYSSAESFNFELNQSEQSRIILKILAYAGIIIKDPQIIQAAAQEIAQDEANAKT